MNKQRKTVITTTYNEMGIVIDTKVEEVTQPNLQPTCNQLTTDTISRQAAIDAAESAYVRGVFPTPFIREVPPAQPEEAIPVSWIESRIERFVTMDNAFGGLTANIMLVMLNEWKREQEGETT